MFIVLRQNAVKVHTNMHVRKISTLEKKFYSAELEKLNSKPYTHELSAEKILLLVRPVKYTTDVNRTVVLSHELLFF